MVRIGAEEKLFLRLKKSFTQTGFEAFRGNLGRKVIGGRGVNFEGIFRFYGILKSLKFLELIFTGRTSACMLVEEWHLLA